VKLFVPAMALIACIGGLTGCGTGSAKVGPIDKQVRLDALVGSWESTVDQLTTRYSFNPDGKGRIDRHVDTTAAMVKGIREGYGEPLSPPLEQAIGEVKVITRSELPFTCSILDGQILHFTYDVPMVRYDSMEPFWKELAKHRSARKVSELRSILEESERESAKALFDRFNRDQSEMRVEVSGQKLRLTTLQRVEQPVSLSLNRVK